MILSRRSLLVSIALHCSLVLGGYFLYQRIQHPVVVMDHQSEPGVRLTSRAVQVEREPAPPSGLRPPALESPGRASEEASPGNDLTPILPQTKSGSSPTISLNSMVRPAYPTAKAPKTQSERAVPTFAPSRPPQSDVATPEPTLDWGLSSPAAKPPETEPKSKVTRRARPLTQPEFNLSARFPDLDSVQVKAKFEVSEDGSFEPTLLTSTGDPTADVVILGKLLEFEWLPAMDKGVPVKDTRELDISLEG